MACLFFGGYNFPLIYRYIHDPLLITITGFVVMMAKTCFFIFFFMWIRWTVPRFRYDQLMNLGWKILIPLSILNIFITGIVMWLTHKI